MSKLKIIILIFLVGLSTLFLFQKGLWLFQDASYWFKNYLEVKTALLNQIFVFSRLYYFHGYDLTVFPFTKIASVFLSYILFLIFGSQFSQIAFIISGFILSFVSFYLLTGIFLNNKDLRYILSLMYVFNPMFFSLLNQGYIHIFAATPFFIYSLYKYLTTKGFRLKFLILNVFSVYLLISYIRFLEIGLILIVFYGTFLLIKNKVKIDLKKILVLIFSYVCLMAPYLLSFFFLITKNTENSVSSFQGVFQGVVANNYSYEAFNIFQSNNLTLYKSPIFIFLGLFLFGFLIYYAILKNKERKSSFYLLNLFLILFSITLYSLGQIVNSSTYFLFLKAFPFLQNVPFYSLYILIIPLIIFVSSLWESNKKALYLFSAMFIFVSILPLLNLSDTQLKKIDISKLPTSYQSYFVDPYSGIPNATFYIPNYCWKGNYTNDIYDPCFNYGLQYSPIQQDNARMLFGANYTLARKLLEFKNLNLLNLRVTHNLKDIIVANDLTISPQADEISSKKAINLVKSAHAFFAKQDLLGSDTNDNFTKFYFKNQNAYDFFIYSPSSTVEKPVQQIFDNKLDIYKRPVIVNQTLKSGIANSGNISIDYKISNLNSTKYYVELSNFNSNSFLLQMNQSYSKNWKIIWINAETFNSVKCGAKSFFSITNNTSCSYSGLFDPRDFSLLSNHSLSESSHLTGNYIGNLWVIDPKTIPLAAIHNGKAYAVIIYEKQIYYNIAILLTVVASIIFLGLMLVQELYNYSIEKYEHTKK